MKNLLALFISLICFFSCEEGSGETNYDCSATGCVEDTSGQWATLEDCENVCCFCGQILELDSASILPWPGGFQYSSELTDSFYVDAYDGYQFFEIINYCSGNIAVGCYDWVVGAEGYSVGDVYCMEWSNYMWGEFSSFIGGDWVLDSGCMGDSIVPFNEF